MRAFDVVTPREVRPLIDQLAGRRAGYRDVHAQLERDPCAPHLGAYRLSGPLEPVVCGVHLRNGWRLAFTMRTARRRGERPQVVVLFVGRREPRSRASDAWTILHDLFNVENPPENHSKPPCCQQDIPEIPDEQLTEFLRAVRRLTRHRR